MRILKISLLTMLATLAMNPAYALSIKNLSGSTQVVTIEQGGATRDVIIEKGRTYRYQGGDVVLMMPGQRPKQTDFYEDYVIWPDGKLILQRINKTKGQLN